MDIVWTITELLGQVSTDPQRLRDAYKWYVSPTRIGEPPQVVWFDGCQPLLVGAGLISRTPQSGGRNPGKHWHIPVVILQVPANAQCSSESHLNGGGGDGVGGDGGARPLAPV